MHRRVVDLTRRLVTDVFVRIVMTNRDCAQWLLRNTHWSSSRSAECCSTEKFTSSRFQVTNHICHWAHNSQAVQHWTLAEWMSKSMGPRRSKCQRSMSWISCGKNVNAEDQADAGNRAGAQNYEASRTAWKKMYISRFRFTIIHVATAFYDFQFKVHHQLTIVPQTVTLN